MQRHLIILSLSILLFSCNEQTVRRGDFDVHGIDVSHHQKNIDWEKVATQNVHFAFVKATEGQTHRDTLFCRNWEAMKKIGIKRGAYHFFRPSIPAEAQAKNFIEVAKLEHGDLAPVLDVEVVDGVSKLTLQEGVATWLQIVEEHFKVRPIIYTNQKFFNRKLADRFQDYPIWIARYSSWRKPNLIKNAEWQFWQYGNRGQLDGISGPVDFNVFRGSEEALETLCLVRPKPLLDPPPAPEEDAVAATP